MPLAAKIGVVEMQAPPLLVERQQFVLRAIEAAHAGVGLGPDDEIVSGAALQRFSKRLERCRRRTIRTYDPAQSREGESGARRIDRSGLVRPDRIQYPR